ncbi:MAG: hypothetical protein B7Z66_15800 [Chromatiales bacterium 21-64-14]|nr:MAG: hypothetical protein B7Z66_15800 [Chromatiales bacterium 21-64-14]HQU17116.1 WD40 repeat domain-containing protein [Gammaproteobacteria bacterium]
MTRNTFKRAGLLVLLAGLVSFAPAARCDVGDTWRSFLQWVYGDTARENRVTTRLVTLHPKDDIWGLAFSPDGRYLAASSPGSSMIYVWDWRSRRIVRSLNAGWSLGVTVPVTYSPDGRFLAACHIQTTEGGLNHVVVNVWNAESGALVHDIVRCPPGKCEARGG